MSKNTKPLDRSDRGWQQVAAPLRAVIKTALVQAALAGRITPEEAFERIHRYGLRDA